MIFDVIQPFHISYIYHLNCARQTKGCHHDMILSMMLAFIFRQVNLSGAESFEVTCLAASFGDMFSRR
jgi:hypothetical protein